MYEVQQRLPYEGWETVQEFRSEAPALDYAKELRERNLDIGLHYRVVEILWASL